MKIDNIHIIHNYNKMVRRGAATPLTHRCGDTYTVATTDDEVYLRCLACNEKLHIGLETEETIRKITEAYFD